MDNHKICDTCRYYYGYSLTKGVCMIFFLTIENPIDKNVNYYDSCHNWEPNDDPKEWQLIRKDYLELKDHYANLKRKSKEEAGIK